MKEIILTLLMLLLLGPVDGDSSEHDRRYKVLKFGNTARDYIRYQPDMGPLANAFSVCFWVRKLRSTGWPHVISYEGNGLNDEIVVSDEGRYNFIFNSNVDLRNKFTVTPGTWYHYCLTWSLSSRTQRVYLNGRLISSRSTPSGRTLRNGGYLVIGNDAGPSGTSMSTSYVFGGELYKLNFFSKELSSSEVQDMARDKCSEVEETYGEVRRIRWEDILSMRRNGDVTEIGEECEKINKLRAELSKTETKLNETVEELRQATEEKEACAAGLEKKEKQVNDTLEELRRTSQEKAACITSLQDKGQQLNATEAEKDRTTKKLAQTEASLNATVTTLNQTQAELEQVKVLLEKAVAASSDCAVNSTVTSHWDMLYSQEFYGGIVNAEKRTVLRKSLEKLEYFDGMRVTDGLIRFLKLFHDGDEQCPS